ncbi:type II toxin-antitoxin system RelE/ParE family toxin [Candidatus Microgenomates bacterium]|nr:type II toxin-antitoxin system RelE/ParE family toxin [Candidatus Microgenomates bacterium]
MYKYFFSEKALSQLQKLPKNIQKRIIKKLDFYCQQERILFFADKIISTKLGEYRFRVGDYRIVFDLEGDKIIILLVGHRKEIYR